MTSGRNYYDELFDRLSGPLVDPLAVESVVRRRTLMGKPQVLERRGPRGEYATGCSGPAGR